MRSKSYKSIVRTYGIYIFLNKLLFYIYNFVQFEYQIRYTNLISFIDSGKNGDNCDKM